MLSRDGQAVALVHRRIAGISRQMRRVHRALAAYLETASLYAINPGEGQGSNQRQHSSQRAQQRMQVIRYLFLPGVVTYQ